MKERIVKAETKKHNDIKWHPLSHFKTLKKQISLKLNIGLIFKLCLRFRLDHKTFQFFCGFTLAVLIT